MKKMLLNTGRNIICVLTCTVALFLLPRSPIIAQLPSGIEKAADEYYQEILKVYQYIESEEPSVALERIDDLIPAIDKKAKVLVELAEDDPEVMELLDSDDSYLLFEDKPYFKEMMRIMQSEAFINKLESNSELQDKIEEVEGIIESYEASPQADEGEEEKGNAFTLTIQEGEFQGTYIIMADFEESAVAYPDDQDYLMIDIFGNSDEEESSVSFFVENTGKGKQPWETEGQFTYEQLDSEGDMKFTLWGLEDMGYIEITSVNGPGSFVTGRIQGTCSLDNGEEEENVRISADFKVKYIEPGY